MGTMGTMGIEAERKTMDNTSKSKMIGLVRELTGVQRENEWVEFKENKSDPVEIGEYVSALSNSAAIAGRNSAFIVWGVRDGDRAIVGTTFDPSTAKMGNELLESWLLHKLSPRIGICFHEVDIDNNRVVLLEIDRAQRQPTRFDGDEYIRVGSYKKAEGLSGKSASALAIIRFDAV